MKTKTKLFSTSLYCLGSISAISFCSYAISCKQINNIELKNKKENQLNQIIVNSNVKQQYDNQIKPLEQNLSSKNNKESKWYDKKGYIFALSFFCFAIIIFIFWLSFAFKIRKQKIYHQKKLDK